MSPATIIDVPKTEDKGTDFEGLFFHFLSEIYLSFRVFRVKKSSHSDLKSNQETLLISFTLIWQKTSGPILFI